MTDPSRQEKTIGGAWDSLSRWWLEVFTNGADVEYERQIIPLIVDKLAGSRRICDLGCGEGQVARRLGRSEPERLVVGVDPSSAQLAHARQAERDPARRGGVEFVRAVGEELPFSDGAFDAVFCCLAIEHAADVDAVLREAARLTATGGRFLLIVNHPVFQGAGSGLIDDTILNERYWRVGRYLVEETSEEEVDPGIRITFAHRPMSRYINPLGEQDLVLTALFEPAPIEEFLASSVAPELEGAIPRLAAFLFEHRPKPGHRRGEKGFSP